MKTGLASMLLSLLQEVAASELPELLEAPINDLRRLRSVTNDRSVTKRSREREARAQRILVPSN